jgi:DNA-binding XRE family transcriptional regulator
LILEATLLEELRLNTSKERNMKQMATKMRITKSHGIQNLRVLRQRKGLSLGQLANLSGLRRDTISHLENGREEPQPYHLRILARVLGVATLDLVS